MNKDQKRGMNKVAQEVLAAHISASHLRLTDEIERLETECDEIADVLRSLRDTQFRPPYISEEVAWCKAIGDSDAILERLGK